MISKLAVVHPEARLGQGVVVEPFACISADVTIGDGTWVGPHAVILDGAIIGNNCRIHSSAVIAGEPQDLKFKGEKTVAIIGNNTTVREFCTVNRGTVAKGRTVVGDNCLLMAYAHVGHDCVVGDWVVLVNGVSLAGEVQVDDWAIVGGHTGVHQFCHIGAHSMVGGVSKIGRDVPPFVRASHEPTSYVGVNAIGLRRRGFTNEQITQIQDIYRILFQSSLSVSSAVARIEVEFESSEHRDSILGFIRGSSRGLIKHYQTRRSGDDSDM